MERLLKETPFRSVLGQPWQHSLESDAEAHAPSTQAGFHIVPRNYEGAFLEVTSRKCMTCHDTVGLHANDFQFGRDCTHSRAILHPTSAGIVLKSAKISARCCRPRSRMMSAKSVW